MALDIDSLTPDQLRTLATAIQKSQLLSHAEELDKQQGARLHDEKNAPWAPGGYYEKALKELPKNTGFREFPKMLYSVDYLPAEREYQAALRYRERRDEPGVRDDMIRFAMASLTAATKKVNSTAEETQATDTGLWATTAQGALDAKERREQAVAQAALQSAGDDRRMSAAAKAEREAADAASEGHLVEVPQGAKRK